MTTPAPAPSLRDRIAAAILARIKQAVIHPGTPRLDDGTEHLLAANEYDLADVVLPLVAEAHDGCYVCEPCGFHWHGRTPSEVVPMRDGQPVCPRCEIDRIRARADAEDGAR